MGILIILILYLLNIFKTQAHFSDFLRRPNSEVKNGEPTLFVSDIRRISKNRKDLVALDSPYLDSKVFPLKWVFCYSSYVRDYDEMLKVSVLSAISKTSLIPVCIFYGDENDIYIYGF